MNKLKVFIKDTFIKNVKSIGFISMLLTPLIVIGIVIAIIYFTGSASSGLSDVDIAVISEDPSIGAIIQESEDSITVMEGVQTVEEAEAEMKAEDLNGYIVADWEGENLQASMTYTGSMDMHIEAIQQILNGMQMMARAQALDISPEEAQGLNEPVILENHIVSIDAGEIVEEDGLANMIAIGSAYFINIMIMMFIMFYATTVI